MGHKNHRTDSGRRCGRSLERQQELCGPLDELFPARGHPRHRRAVHRAMIRRPADGHYRVALQLAGSTVARRRRHAPQRHDGNLGEVEQRRGVRAANGAHIRHGDGAVLEVVLPKFVVLGQLLQPRQLPCDACDRFRLHRLNVGDHQAVGRGHGHADVVISPQSHLAAVGVGGRVEPGVLGERNAERFDQQWQVGEFGALERACSDEGTADVAQRVHAELVAEEEVRHRVGCVHCLHHRASIPAHGHDDVARRGRCDCWRGGGRRRATHGWRESRIRAVEEGQDVLFDDATTLAAARDCAEVDAVLPRDGAHGGCCQRTHGSS
mmetsp:Transcript_1539/g.6086  ORF Transcript_1539/g.6086 Transcript_1539/m.6086 type:complete len:323 (-) Transcript_1539:465-1433(-)